MIYASGILLFQISTFIKETVRMSALSKMSNYTSQMMKIVMVPGLYLKVHKILSFVQRSTHFLDLITHTPQRE